MVVLFVFIVVKNAINERVDQRIKHEEERMLCQKERQELEEKYNGKHISSFVDIPKGSEIGWDNLPREIGTKIYWGEKYTFYVSLHGKSYHKKNCRFARDGMGKNAYTVKYRYSPCSYCNPVLPPLDWVKKYRELEELVKKNNLNVDFSLEPGDLPSYVIYADRSILPKTFIERLDPELARRAIDEHFSIDTSNEEKNSIFPFDSRPIIVSERNQIRYATELRYCTCWSNAMFQRVCEHMIALAIYKGALKIDRDMLLGECKEAEEEKTRQQAKEREQAELARKEQEEKEKALKEEEERQKKQRLEQEREQRERYRAICEEQERQKREAEARAKREQEEKLRKLHETCDGKHILSFVNIPNGSEIGPDNLPRDIDAKSYWGNTYTFFATKSGSFHIRDCRYARYGQAINALAVGEDRRPCKLCGATLPPLEWAREYRKIRNLATAYNLNVDFTPPPSWYPPFVIRADQNILSKSFVLNLDPARVRRALEESFTITEAEDQRTATVTHEGEPEGYATSLTHCTCRDNSFRHAVCKHMIALAIHKGALEIKESKLPE